MTADRLTAEVLDEQLEKVERLAAKDADERLLHVDGPLFVGPPPGFYAPLGAPDLAGDFVEGPLGAGWQDLGYTTDEGYGLPVIKPDLDDGEVSALAQRFRDGRGRDAVAIPSEPVTISFLLGADGTRALRGFLRHWGLPIPPVFNAQQRATLHQAYDRRRRARRRRGRR